MPKKKKVIWGTNYHKAIFVENFKFGEWRVGPFRIKSKKEKKKKKTSETSLSNENVT